MSDEEVQPIGEAAQFVPVPLAPIETRVLWEPAVLEGVGPVVVLTYSTPLGQASYFMPPTAARSMSEGLIQAAHTAEAAVVSARSKLIVPDVDTAAVLKSLGNGKRKGRR